MEIKGSNRYRVTQLLSLNNENLLALAVLYVPFIGTRGLSLYQMLAAEANRRSYEMTLDRICTLLDMIINELAESIKLLEQFKLLKTFYNRHDDSFRFELQPPLSVNKFLSHEVFSRLYAKKVGNRQYEITKTLHLTEKLEDENDLEVTSQFDISLFNSKWDMSDELNFSKVSRNDYQDIRPEFDINAFLRGFSMLQMPPEFRTRANLELIAQMATVYSIDIPTMRVIVTDCIDIDEGTFDIEKMRNKCISAKSVSTVTGTGNYDVPPVQFLYDLQGGIPVNAADKKILEYMQLELKLNREVINCLVEKVFSTNKSLNRNYIEKIATSWALKGIDTLDKAKDALEIQPSRKYNKVPDFKSRDYESESSEQSYDEIMGRLFSKEGK
ncbi:MAG: hypothetical protein E7193_04255 [Erysipelotrichaceae bacterium]|nr:hypothetical protein [Erysipelotrichaceae bacterium]